MSSEQHLEIDENNDEYNYAAPSDDDEILIEDWVNMMSQEIDDQGTNSEMNELEIILNEISDSLQEAPSTSAKDFLFNLGNDASIKLNALPPEFVGDTITPYKVFKLFLTDDILQQFTNNTRGYALSMLSKYNYKEDRKQQLTDISCDEIESFIISMFWIALDPKSSIRKYFETVEASSCRSEHKLEKLFTRDRFEYILRRFHASDAFSPSNQYEDKLIKIRVFIDHFNRISPTMMHSGTYISSDECVIGFNGAHYAKVKCKGKMVGSGFWFYAQSDPRSGYMYQLKLKDKLTSYDANVPKLVGILDSLSSWAQKGRVFVLDNYYTTLNLALHFLEKGQYILGTIKKQRVPSLVKNKSIADDDYDWTIVKQNNKNITFLRIFHRGFNRTVKKVVYLLCTHPFISQQLTINTSRRYSSNNELAARHILVKGKANVSAPFMSASYSHNLGEVDRFDRKLASSVKTIKSKKWWFRFILVIYTCNED